MTQPNVDRDSFCKNVTAFIEAVEKNIILGSMTRKKKFKKIETYPVIAP